MPLVQLAFAGSFNAAVSASNPANTSTVFAVPKLWDSGTGLLTTAPPYVFIQAGVTSTKMHPSTGIAQMYTKEINAGGRLLTMCINLYMPGRGANGQATFVRSNALTTAWYGTMTSLTFQTDSAVAGVSALGSEFADLVHSLANKVLN